MNTKTARMPYGIHTALVTPFDSRTGENIDKDGFLRLINMQLEANVPGIVVLGTTGESPTVTDKERDLLIQTAAEALEGETMTLTVGCGTNDTAKTVSLIKRAAALGANAALLVAPYYNRPDKRGLLRHFLTAAEASEIPIVLYNVPSRTGVDLDVETLCVLSRHPNIIALKEASADISSVTSKFAALEDFDIFCGNDALLYPFLCLGARGAVAVASNAAPGELCRLCSDFEKGDVAAAKKCFYSLLPLFSALSLEVNPVPIKALLGLNGVISPRVRPPLYQLRRENQTELLYAATEAGIIL